MKDALGATDGLFAVYDRNGESASHVSRTPFTYDEIVDKLKRNNFDQVDITLDLNTGTGTANFSGGRLELRYVTGEDRQPWSSRSRTPCSAAPATAPSTR